MPRAFQQNYIGNHQKKESHKVKEPNEVQNGECLWEFVGNADQTDPCWYKQYSMKEVVKAKSV